MKYIIFVLIVAFMLSGSLALAQENDLPEAGLTPESSFYFLDRMGDWFRLNVFTFNPVRKAEVKVKIAEERLSELNVLSQKEVKAEILEKLEEAVTKRAEEAFQDAESLDAQNRDVSRLVEHLSDFNLKRQRVLENVLERVPEEARDKVEAALRNVYAKAQGHKEIILRQKEKGFVSEEKAKEIIENRLEKMEEQLERQKERISQIENEALKERLGGVIEKKLELLESDILEIESREDYQELREEMREVQKEAVESALNLRRMLKLRATTTEEALENIRQRKDNRENQ